MDRQELERIRFAATARLEDLHGSGIVRHKSNPLVLRLVDYIDGLEAEVARLRDRVAELEQLKDPDVDWIRTMNRHVEVAGKQIERLRAEVADKDRIIEDLEYHVQALTPVGEG